MSQYAENLDCRTPACMDLFIVYLICLGGGLFLTLLMSAFSHFGAHEGGDGHLGGGGHAEAGLDGSDMPGLAPLSPTSVAVFVTAFGAFGLIVTRFDALTGWVSIPLAVLGAFGIAAGVVAMFRAIFSRTQSSSESHTGKLVGMPAAIITPIPQGGVGEISYVDSGSRYTAAARSETGATIPSGESVVITRIVGTQFYVQRP